MHITITRILAFGATAALATAAVPFATAQIPGDNPRSWVYPVDNESISIAVDPVDTENGTVGVTIQNNTEQNLNCTGIDGSQAATVTNAETVARSVDFYTNYPHSDFADLNLYVSILFTTIDEDIPLGSVVDMVPGSAGAMVNPEWGALGEVGESYNNASLAGQVGQMGTSFSVNAQDSQSYTVELQQPTSGTWEEFQTGVFATCAIDGQRFVFHGYEGNERPVLPSADGSLGSLGSAGLGS